MKYLGVTYGLAAIAGLGAHLKFDHDDTSGWALIILAALGGIVAVLVDRSQKP